ncbi:MAG: hypothetical protein ABI656_04590 [bacterium]
MKKYLTFAVGLLTCAGLLLTTAPALARSDVSVGINVGIPGFYAPPVYVVPQPVYIEPQPVYVEPRVIYSQPRPLYIEQGPVYYQRPQWERRKHRGRHWKDREYRDNHEGDRDHGDHERD